MIEFSRCDWLFSNSFSTLNCMVQIKTVMRLWHLWALAQSIEVADLEVYDCPVKRFRHGLEEI